MAYKEISPIPIVEGGTNASTYTQSNGIVTYNGTSLVNYAGPQLSSGGIYTNTTQPAFFSYVSSTQSSVTGDGTLYNVIFDTTTKNVGASYDTTTGVFTAPVTGLYFFNTCITVTGLSTQTNFTILFHTVAVDYFGANINPAGINGGGVLAINSSLGPIPLSSSEAIVMQVSISGGAKTVNVFGVGGPFFTYFSGYLIC